MNELTINKDITGFRDFMKLKSPKKSKIWEYQDMANTLYLPANVAGRHPWYEIDLDRCRNSAQILDWIAQIAAKRWASAMIVADLIWALDDYLGLQAGFCSWGVEQQQPVAYMG